MIGRTQLNKIKNRLRLFDKSVPFGLNFSLTFKVQSTSFQTLPKSYLYFKAMSLINVEFHSNYYLM